MAKSTTSTPQDSAGRRAVRPRPGATPAAPTSLSGARQNAPNLLSFFQESRAELRKVTWPTREQAMNLTLAVIGMTIALAIFLGVIDEGLNQAVNWLLGT